MNLNHLYYFQILANMQHFSLAAAQCYITQPNLSYAIKSLESELNVQLVERKGRNACLTDAGKLFLEYVDRALSELEKGKKLLRDIPSFEQKKIIIGTRRVNYVSFMIGRFLSSEQFKDITVETYQTTTDKILEELSTNRIDVGFCTRKTDAADISFFPIRDQDLVLIVPLNHPLAQFDEIDLKMTEGYSFIKKTGNTPSTRNISELFKKADISPHYAGATDGFFNLAYMVENNLGIGLVPNLVNMDNFKIKALRISNPIQENYFYLCYNNKTQLSSPVRCFCKFIIRYFCTNSEIL